MLILNMPVEISLVATSLLAASPDGPIAALRFLNTLASYPISTEAAATEVLPWLAIVTGSVIHPPASPLLEPIDIVGAEGSVVVVVEIVVEVGVVVVPDVVVAEVVVALVVEAVVVVADVEVVDVVVVVEVVVVVVVDGAEVVKDWSFP